MSSIQVSWRCAPWLSSAFASDCSRASSSSAAASHAGASSDPGRSGVTGRASDAGTSASPSSLAALGMLWSCMGGLRRGAHVAAHRQGCGRTRGQGWVGDGTAE